jgi:hypothetical protein
MTHFHDSTDQTNALIEVAERRQSDGIHSATYLRIETRESAQSVSGEPGQGVGSENCDQETRTWNPRLESMNYALARLARAS